MTRAQIEELIVKASKATKGPWTSERVDFESEITFEIGPKHYGDSGFRFILRESNYEIERYPGDFSSNIAKLKGDAEFISSANPDIVTNLCEMVLGLTEALEEIIRVNDNEYFGKSIEGTKAEKALAKFGVKK